MAVNSGQVTRDIKLVAAALGEITQNATLSADSLKILTDALSRLTGTKFDQFKNLSGSIDQFIAALKEGATQTGVLDNKINNVIRAITRLQESGRLKFGFGTGAAEVEKISLGIDVLEKRMMRAARRAGATAEEIQKIADVMKGLRERGTVEGGIVGALNKMNAAGEVSNKVFKAARLSAKLWRAELKRLRAALSDVHEASGQGKPGTVSTGKQQEDKLQLTAAQTIRQQRELYENILPGGKRAIDNVTASLNNMGLSFDDITTVNEDASRGIVQWSASMDLADGITKRATITTDRFGNTLKSTSRNLKSFGGAIIANIAKVAQWTIAIAIVYAPMRKMQELMEQSVEIESKLADVQIALASGQESLNVVWEASAIVARELGVSVEGVIDGYVLAVRATANIISPAEKAAATIAVLKDSMILAKLAGIDQAIAMDTLVGALRQLGLPLTEGTMLVDKWVAVSKAANVSLHTLAESFAITATAAENVGLTMDELNGFIAAVAEVTTLSATESGNAVRAFISGFQRDQSERELNKFGIAVKTVNGELRAFTDVIEDIIERKEIGLISDKELAKISEVIGGGARRGPQVNAFLENYGRVQELAAVSAGASGDAAEAMAVKISTLQSALENLNTAFGELARAMGTDAGFLDLVRGGVDALGKLIDIVTKITKFFGKATPAIIAYVAALKLLKTSRVQDYLAMPPSISPAGMDPSMTRRGALTTLGGLGRGAVGGAGIGLAASLLAGNTEGKKIGTTMGGAAIGQILAQGKPIGGLIGASIVTALWANIIDREADLTEAWKRIFTGAYTGATDAAGKPGKERDFFEEAKIALGGGEDQWFAKDFGGLSTGLAAAGLEKTLKPSQEGIENATLAIMESVIAVAEGTATPDQSLVARIAIGTDAQIQQIYAEVKKLLGEIKKVAEDELKSAEPGAKTRPFGLRLLGISEDLGSQATALLQKARQELMQEVARGEVGIRELVEFQNLGDYEQQVSTVYTALTSLGRVSMDYITVAKTMGDASEQEVMTFERLASEIGVLENAYRELEAATKGYKDAGTRAALAELEDGIRNAQGELSEYLTTAREGQIYKAFEMPTLVKVSPEATEQELAEAVRRAKVITAGIADSAELTGPQRQKLMDSYGTLGLQNAETYRVGLQGITEVSQEVLDNVLEDMGLAADAMDKAMGFQQVDLTAAQLPQLYGNMQYYQNLLGPTGVLDSQPMEDILLLTSDRETDAITAQTLILNLALQDLISISEQQLEGIFNIPDGVTAAIPFTGKLFFSDQPIPTAGGKGIEILGDAVDSLTGETEVIAGLSQTQVDVLQDLLIIGGGSETLLSNIETLLREAGVEPEPRGEPKEPVTWGAEALEDAFNRSVQQMAEIFEGPSLDEALYRENPELRVARFYEETQRAEDAKNPELRLHKYFRSLQEPMDTTATKDFTESLDYFGENIVNGIQQPFQQLFDMFSGLFGLGEDGALGGIGGITSEQVLAALPQSIPVNIQTRITNPVQVLIDGFQVANAIYERNYEDLQSATRRQGAVGYIMEA